MTLERQHIDQLEHQFAELAKEIQAQNKHVAQLEKQVKTQTAKISAITKIINKLKPNRS